MTTVKHCIKYTKTSPPRTIMIQYSLITLLLGSVYIHGDVINPTALNYLKQFGYMPVLKVAHDLVDDTRTSLFYTRTTAFNDALKTFQRFAKIPVTGEFDEATQIKMEERRCGVEDFDGLQREPIQFKWKKPQLTWKLVKSSNKLSTAETRKVLQDAFAEWSNVIPLVFKEVSINQDADINVVFGRKYHGDSTPFDGPGKVLAHAWYPTDGRLHFDDDEEWTKMINPDHKHTSLFSVAVHEIGHNLGLAHSRESDAIMAPFYKSHTTPGESLLDGDDVTQIQQLYGQKEQTTFGSGSFTGLKTKIRRRISNMFPRNKRPTVSTTTQSTPVTTTLSTSYNNQCLADITASLLDFDNRLFVFLRGGAMKMVENRRLVDVPIDSVFADIPRKTQISATVSIKRTNRVILFSGRRFWAYYWNQSSGKYSLEKLFPKTLASEIPFTPSSAFIWKDGNTIITDGMTFCTYDENWNKCTLQSPVSKYFKIPRDTLAISQHPSDPRISLVFTPNNIFEYNLNSGTLSLVDVDSVVIC